MKEIDAQSKILYLFAPKHHHFPHHSLEFSTTDSMLHVHSQSMHMQSLLFSSTRRYKNLYLATVGEIDTMVKQMFS